MAPGKNTTEIVTIGAEDTQKSPTFESNKGHDAEKTIQAQGHKEVTLIPQPSDDPRDPLV